MVVVRERKTEQEGGVIRGTINQIINCNKNKHRALYSMHHKNMKTRDNTQGSAHTYGRSLMSPSLGRPGKGWRHQESGLRSLSQDSLAP
jgi:hypothetical protein